MTRIIGIGLAAAAWGLLTFALGLRVHFPEDALIERLQWEVQEGSDGAYALEAAGASPWRLSGVVLKDATLYTVKKAPRRLPRSRRLRDDASGDGEGEGEGEDAAAAEEPAEQKGDVFLRAEHMALRLEPLSLLMGTRAARFKTDLFGGNLSGRVGLGSDLTDIDATLEDVNLAMIPLSGDGWMADLGGELKLNVDLALGGEKSKDSAGTVELRIEQFVINSIEMMGFTLDDPTVFTEAFLNLEANNGKLEITEARFTSEPVEIELGGYIQLAKSLDRVRLRIDLKVKLSDALDGLAKNLPQMKNARDKEGVYHFLVTGTPDAPQFREDPAVRRTNVGPSDTRRRIEDRVRAQEEGMSDEEKQRLRDERMQRMQDRMRGSRPDGEPGEPGEPPPDQLIGGPGLRPPGRNGEFGPGRTGALRPPPDNEPDFNDEGDFPPDDGGDFQPDDGGDFQPDDGGDFQPDDGEYFGEEDE